MQEEREKQREKILRRGAIPTCVTGAEYEKTEKWVYAGSLWFNEVKRKKSRLKQKDTLCNSDLRKTTNVGPKTPNTIFKQKINKDA